LVAATHWRNVWALRAVRSMGENKSKTALGTEARMWGSFVIDRDNQTG
jgi:hypothetical protein